MGGTQGRYGSTSVENIDEFFFHDCKLNLNGLYKKNQNFPKTEEGRPRRTFYG